MYRKQSPNMITVHSSDNGPIVRNYTNDSSKFKLALCKSSEDINEIPCENIEYNFKTPNKSLLIQGPGQER